jgi:DNA-binding transcriptional LysR family regulator
VELRHLRYFIAVAESLHFGHAAAALRIAQPSLSHQIKQLEAELSSALLRRTKRRVELTEAGRLFLDDARDIVARADRAAMIARRTGQTVARRLRIGIGYCMDHAPVSQAVSAFGGKRPAIRAEVQTIAVPSQLRALHDQTLDVGFVRPPITDQDLASEIVIREPIVAALPAGHRLAGKATIALSALASDPFILVPRDAVPVYHDVVLKMCREAGFVPHSPHEADHVQLLLAMVSEGSGVALVPGFARRIKPPGVAFATLRPRPPDLEVAVAWRKDNESVLVNEFVKAVREQCAARQRRHTDHGRRRPA